MINLLCADSYEWLKTQPDKYFDHVITDYEYGSIFPFEELLRVTKGNIMTFCAAEDYPFKPTEVAHWIKTPSTKNNKASRRLSRFVEHIFIYRQGDTFNVEEEDEEGLHWSNYKGFYEDLVEIKGHPWKKPYSLMERLVRIYTNEGDLILDPFCGEGTTMEACEYNNRNSVGVDKEEKWVNVCRERLRNYTQRFVRFYRPMDCNV